MEATFSARLRELMASRSLKQVDVLEAAKPYCEKYQVKLGKSDLSQYVNGITEPGQWKLAILALALNVSEGWLTGLDVPMERTAPAPPNLFPMPGGRQIPLIGTIACGEPILAEEKDGEKAFLPAHMDADFALRCQGDSMIGANIMDGDLVYIKQTSEVQNGGIYAVLIDGMECEATLKHVYFDREAKILTITADNPRFPPRTFTGTAVDRIRLIGRAVGFTRTLNH